MKSAIGGGLGGAGGAMIGGALGGKTGTIIGGAAGGAVGAAATTTGDGRTGAVVGGAIGGGAGAAIGQQVGGKNGAVVGAGVGGAAGAAIGRDATSSGSKSTSGPVRATVATQPARQRVAMDYEDDDRGCGKRKHHGPPAHAKGLAKGHYKHCR